MFCLLPAMIITVLVTEISTKSVLLSSSHHGRSEPSTFRAAVYEHKPLLPTHDTDTREEALEVMFKNLEDYRTQAVKARQMGAQIIVFPEDGIYGWRFSTRKSILPFLEKIPDPKTTTWSPCSDPGRYPNTEVQHALSCIAQETGMYLVANMGDLLPCNGPEDTSCPRDGGYQYNTDVAYNPEGTLVAKYHKVNLYFESQFDKPEPEVVYFDTPFGRFGMLVCFDLLFKTPARRMLKEHNIANVAYTTAWMDALPMLSAIGYHSSFARGTGVNFLAANIHKPSKRLQGSGIYTPEGVEKYYYNNTVNSQGKLLVASLDILESNADVEDELIQNKQIINPLNNTGKEFYSSLLHDEYKFQLLEGKSGNVTVCHNNLCCSLSYSQSDDDQPESELFALGAFDDLHTYHGQYYLQTCALVKCGNNNNRMSCGHYTFDSGTKFDHLALTGTFQAKFVYPQVLMVEDGQLLLGDKSSWSFKDNVLRSQGGLDKPLLSAILLGRYYDLD